MRLIGLPCSSVIWTIRPDSGSISVAFLRSGGVLGGSGEAGRFLEGEANSSGCFCTGVDLVVDVLAGLAGEDLSGEDLAGEDLSGEDLAGEDLSGEDLAGEDPAGEDLTGEDLAGEDLSGEDLTDEDLAGEDLSGEDLAGEDLSGEDLTGEDLAGEDLSRECPAMGASSSDSRSLGPSDTPLELDSDSSTLILFLRTHFLAMT
jgi:uncharacterized protein YjbI with pentapeptide repeats